MQPSSEHRVSGAGAHAGTHGSSDLLRCEGAAERRLRNWLRPDVISKGAAGSWQMENRALTMADDKFDFGFAVNWMRKDLKIVLEEAQRNKARLPATALIDQFYAQVQERGGDRWDTSSLIHLLMHK